MVKTVTTTYASERQTDGYYKSDVYERELEREYIHQVDVYFGFFTIKSAVTIIGTFQFLLVMTALFQSI